MNQQASLASSGQSFTMQLNTDPLLTLPTIDRIKFKLISLVLLNKVAACFSDTLHSLS